MKRYFSLILALLMAFSIVSAISVSAENEAEDIKTNRYYFYLPEEWENQYSSTVGIYWWNGTNAHSDYPGVEAEKTDIKGLYYYDVPEDVEYICWNNLVDDENRDYTLSCFAQTFNNKNKVYVLDMDKTFQSIGSDSIEYHGQWYYYYGNGEYGLTEIKGENFYSLRAFGGDNPAPTLETNRYYFYMPEDWENILSSYAGIYWWEGTNNCKEYWPGYSAQGTTTDGLYYYDVPKDVTTIVWNNRIDDQTGANDVLESLAKQTKLIDCQRYEPGENSLYPDGTESFDNMVYVINYDETEITWDSCVLRGDWYYYYGDGEYGTTPEKGEVFYNTRQLGTIPESRQRPSDSEITVYFLDQFDRAPICINYTYGAKGEEITESGEMTFEATSRKGTLYSFNIPEDCESIYFSTDSQRTFDIHKYIVHNACFQFGVTVNGKYDYKAYLLDTNLNKIDVLLGDANQDGRITIQDATEIQKYLAKMLIMGGTAKTAADFNEDEKITIKDATAIQKQIAKVQ